MAGFWVLRFVFFMSVVAGQTLKLTADGCADPLGFSSCWDAAASAEQSCDTNNCGTATNQNPDCVTDCACVGYRDYINCALTHCWNKAYTCEYMDLVVEAYRNCPTMGTGTITNGPTFAFSTSLPDSCSCDIYGVYHRHRTSSDFAATCWNRGNPEHECYCCADSEAVSTFYNICPDTNPSAIPFFSDLINPSLVDLGSTNCQNVFASGVNCLGLNYSVPGLQSDSQFYTADDLPANGTNSLSNSPGTVTSPPGGATYVWTFSPDELVTAIAASFQNAAAPSSEVPAPSFTAASGSSSAPHSTGALGGGTATPSKITSPVTTPTTSPAATTTSFAAGVPSVPSFMAWMWLFALAFILL